MHLCVSTDGTAPPRSELGFLTAEVGIGIQLPRSAALAADATSAQEH